MEPGQATLPGIFRGGGVIAASVVGEKGVGRFRIHHKFVGLPVLAQHGFDGLDIRAGVAIAAQSQFRGRFFNYPKLYRRCFAAEALLAILLPVLLTPAAGQIVCSLRHGVIPAPPVPELFF